MSERATSYARAMLEVARSEADAVIVEDELFRFGQALSQSDELRDTLVNPQLPPARRQQVVEELLAGRASEITTSLVSMVVGAGRGRELPEIISAFVELSASERDLAVAEVRSAIDLNDDQRQRLAAALKQATGRDVEVKVIVDPSVMGGMITQIGDTVIDGSVRTRLGQLRESMAS